MKVGEMMPSLRWRMTEGKNKRAHIIDGQNHAYCGAFVNWDSIVGDDDVVCERCLKATEKYA